MTGQIDGYFNSSMVRLKAMFKAGDMCSDGNFNSSMVRLKGDLNLKPKSLNTYFNSSMVRLKDKWRPALKVGLIKFQFLYGAIKSVMLTA